ncbi:glycosyltransferase family 2 protein [Desulfococcaceae bacterium HSG7]|nr:glycosyltransferase family 2 protein [Desulfococcaceae bacterium HSG7]
MEHHISPLVTVVTVTRNAEASIERTIISVCSQKYANIEYIVIDGNSSDNTLAIIRKYSHGISQFINEEDGGIYDAMNKGIRLASSNSHFITFLNAGDVFHDSDVIKDIASSVRLTRSHVYGNFTKAWQVVQTPAKINNYVLSTNMVCHQAIFFRTGTHRKYLYDTRFKICADYKLLIDLTRAGEQFFKINKTIVNFDMSGVTHRNRASLHTEKKRIRRMHPKIFLYNMLKHSFRRLRKYLPI